MRIIVVGGGLLGASAAHRLAAGGAAVTVLEAGRAGAGASGASFAWLNAQQKAPAAYFDLNVAGLAEHARLAAELGGDGWHHGGGNLQVGAGDAGQRIRDLADRHAAMGYPVELLDPAAAAALEPGLAVPDGPGAVAAWYPGEGWLTGPVLVGRLLDAARAHGAEVWEGTPVAALEPAAGGVAVRLADGRRLEPATVVLAAGAASEGLARSAGVHLPMAPTPGLLAVIAPAGAGPRRVVHAAGLTLRPDGGGRTLVASRAVDADLPPGLDALPADAPEGAALLERAVRAYPGLAGLRVEALRVGRRSVAMDGLPVAGPVPGVPGLHLLVSHSGATLAALLGRLVAEAVTGPVPPALAPFAPAPDRFGTAAERPQHPPGA